MHGLPLWIYVIVVPVEVLSAVAFIAWVACNRVDETLERLISTALLLHKHGYEEAAARLLRTARETHGRRAVAHAMRTRR